MWRPGNIQQRQRENHRQQRLDSSARQDNSCTAKSGMQGLLNSAGGGGGGGEAREEKEGQE